MNFKNILIKVFEELFKYKNLVKKVKNMFCIDILKYYFICI